MKKNLDPEAKRFYWELERENDFGRGKRIQSDVMPGDALGTYLDLASKDLKELHQRRDRSRFPSSLSFAVAEELGAFDSRKAYPPSIRGYVELVRHAGQVIEQRDLTSGENGRDR